MEKVEIEDKILLQSQRVETQKINEEEKNPESNFVQIPNFKRVKESGWFEQTKADFGEKIIYIRPSPLPWYSFYISQMKFNLIKGMDFSEKIRKTILQISHDSINSLQELILDGDLGTFEYQLNREFERSDSKFKLETQNSIMQFATLTGSTKLIDLILSYPGGVQLLNKGDLVTGFSALHFALFIENSVMFKHLIERKANPAMRDKFGGTIFDYARMLGIIPLKTRYKSPPYFQVWNSELQKIETWSQLQLEETLQIEYIPYVTCDKDYIFELLFSGFSINEKDENFRKQYIPQIYQCTGEENLILGKINDQVGYGVFAAKDFQEGEFIVRYAGHLTKSNKIKDKSYNMESGIEGIGLDASKKRGYGAMLNHSNNPNAESQCIVDRGIEQAIIISKKNIPKGHQILIDYSKQYWTESTLKEHQLQDMDSVLPLPIS